MVFVRAVVVANDGAGTDIDVAANGRIADVCQMVDLAAFVDGRFFDFDEVADFDVIVQSRAGSHPRERANLTRFAGGRALNMAVGV